MKEPDVTYPDQLPGVVAGPDRQGLAPSVAHVVLVPHGREEFWLVRAEPDQVTAALAARTLSVIVVHRQVPFLHPRYNPRCEAPAAAFFGPTGVIGDYRMPFPASVVAELERVTLVLRKNHAEYVQHFANALKGVRDAAFVLPPAGSPITNPTDECSWVPLPPVVSIREKDFHPYDAAQLFGYDYDQNRYLQSASEEELAQRAEDALVNMHNFEEAGTVLLDLGDSTAFRAATRLTEAWEEYRLRHGGELKDWLGTLVARWKLPDSSGPRVGSVVQFIGSLRNSITDGFVKYGRLDHLTEMRDSGRVRLSPASSFKDPSLNRARHADELEFDSPLDLAELASPKNSVSHVADEAESLGAASSMRSSTDFYVFCASRSLTARLFYDFQEPDSTVACLVIRDRREFTRRFANAVASALPGWQVGSCDVTYFDRYSPIARSARIPTHKPWRYEYQREYRLFSWPDVAVAQLSERFIDLGPLGDIATLFVPEGG